MRGASARPRYHDDRFDQGWCTVCVLVSDFFGVPLLGFSTCDIDERLSTKKAS